MKRILIALAVVFFGIALATTTKAAPIETIEIDLEQTPVTAQAEPETDPDQTQFMYLVGLASLGLLGIAGVVRDVRKDRA